MNRSLQKSDVSEALSLLFKKKAMWVIHCDSRKLLAKNEWFAQKICSFLMFFLWQFFPPFMLTSLFAHSLFFKERLEQFSRVALYKRATMSDSLRSLMTKEQPWAIRSGRSWQKSDGSDSLFFMSKLLFCSKKMSELRTIDYRRLKQLKQLKHQQSVESVKSVKR